MKFTMQHINLRFSQDCKTFIYVCSYEMQCNTSHKSHNIQMSDPLQMLTSTLKFATVLAISGKSIKTMNSI